MSALKSLAAALTATVLMAAVSPAHAQATRTWVSGVGDDVNPCSRTAPCKTWAGAISKTAAGGEINCLDPAGYGAVTITKSMTIDCRGTLGSALNSGTNGININAAGALVILRHIAINGAGTGLNGVNIIAAGAVHIEEVTISGQTGAAILDSRAGPAKLFVQDSVLRANNGPGIIVAPSGGARCSRF